MIGIQLARVCKDDRLPPRDRAGMVTLSWPLLRRHSVQYDSVRIYPHFGGHSGLSFGSQNILFLIDTRLEFRD